MGCGESRPRKPPPKSKKDRGLTNNILTVATLNYSQPVISPLEHGVREECKDLEKLGTIFRELIPKYIE